MDINVQLLRITDLKIYDSSNFSFLFLQYSRFVGNWHGYIDHFQLMRDRTIIRIFSGYDTKYNKRKLLVRFRETGARGNTLYVGLFY